MSGGGGKGLRRPALAAALLLAGALLAVLVAAQVASPGSPLGGGALVGVATGAGEVPTARAERRPFRLTIHAEGVLTSVRAEPLSVPQTASGPGRIAWMAPDGSRVEEGEVVVRFDPSELEGEKLSAEAGLARSRHNLTRHQAQAGSEISGLERDAGVARMEEEIAERFKTDDDDIYSRLEIAQSEIDGVLAAERRRHAETARRRQEELSRVEGQLLAIERRRHELDLERTQQGLASLEITAPHDGILVINRDRRGEPMKVGDSAWPGQKVAEIPDLSEMQAEIYVLEADAGSLAAGKPAELTIEAHPGRAYRAEISRVGKLAQQRLRSSPVQYFTVLLDLERTDTERMFPGQRVRASLLLADLPEALVVPRQAIFEREGRTVVFRRTPEGDGFEAVAVSVGLIGPAEVVIESGLEAGDVVALADPEGGEPEPEEGEEPGAPAGPALGLLGGGAGEGRG